MRGKNTHSVVGADQEHATSELVSDDDSPVVQQHGVGNATELNKL